MSKPIPNLPRAKTFNYFLCMVACFLFVTCAPERDLSQNVLIAHLNTDPQTLHPTNAFSQQALYFYDYIHKTLLRTDLRTNQKIPLLLVELPVTTDGQLFTYTLRNDVKWDDGTALTAEDVEFSVKINMHPLTKNTITKGNYDNVESLLRFEDNPFTFVLKTKDIHFNNPYILADIVILQKKLWDPKGVLDNVSIYKIENQANNASEEVIKWMEEFNSSDNGRKPENLIGLGAYKVTDWSTGSSITLEKKKNWWGEKDTSVYNKAFPEKIIFRFIRDEAAVVMALKKQTLDVVTTLTTGELLKLQQREYFNQNYTSGFTIQYSYNLIGLNTRPNETRNPFFADKNVRWAISYLMPVEELNQVLALGRGFRLASYVMPNDTQNYNNQLKLIQLNIEKAKNLLTQAGWIDTDGNNIRDKIINGKKVQLSFSLKYPSTSAVKDLVLIVKNAMYQGGVDVKLEPVEFSMMMQSLITRDFDALLLTLGGNPPPGDDPAQLWHTENWANGGFNFTGFGTTETDKLIELSNKTTDLAVRAKYLKKLQEKIYDDQPVVFLYGVTRKVVLHNRFMNVNMYDERPGVMLNNMRLKGLPVPINSNLPTTPAVN